MPTSSSLLSIRPTRLEWFCFVFMWVALLSASAHTEEQIDIKLFAEGKTSVKQISYSATPSPSGLVMGTTLLEIAIEKEFLGKIDSINMVIENEKGLFVSAPIVGRESNRQFVFRFRIRDSLLPITYLQVVRPFSNTAPLPIIFIPLKQLSKGALAPIIPND